MIEYKEKQTFKILFLDLFLDLLFLNVLKLRHTCTLDDIDVERNSVTSSLH